MRQNMQNIIMVFIFKEIKKQIIKLYLGSLDINTTKLPYIW